MLTVNKLFEGWVFDQTGKRQSVFFNGGDVAGHTIWQDDEKGRKRFFANLNHPIHRQVEIIAATLRQTSYGTECHGEPS